MTATPEQIDAFIAEWAPTGGSELANTQSFVNGLAALIGVDPPKGSRADDAHNDYVFERRVFQKEADGSESFGRIDAYKRNSFVLEAKQGSEADRTAAEKGEADLDIFGQTAAVRVKRGTARRGTPGWSKAMDSARGQAERYAKAVPVEHGWPPFLLVTDVGYCIDVYADFSGTGKQYTQFPDAARFRIMLDDLRDGEVRERLAKIWTEPHSLDASKEAAKVTREIADKLAELSKRLEARENNPTRVADFLMRCLFTMFAEDVDLIPKGSFTELLENLRDDPDNFAPALSALWAGMDSGGYVGVLGKVGTTVKKFNGYLFKDKTVIALKPDEIGLLLAAAEKKWDKVEPAIFGTLLERALEAKERAKLGAHYTPRAYVERLVMPTVIEPLRADWDGVRAAAGQLIEAGSADEAKKAVEDFHRKLAQTYVLDPACGTGNFLYVAMAQMKALEGEVVALLIELGDRQYVAELSGHTITPENFLGIEINPRAAAIAQLVLWIGYLQWHFRVNGADRMPSEPILRDVRTIENRDALMTWDRTELVRDDRGQPLHRWDGITKLKDPVSGRKVPDPSARMERLRYINPKAARWPKADFIVGNPPFIGNKLMRRRLDDGYVDALRRCWGKVPGDVDYVMYWWHVAAGAVRAGTARSFGFISTNSIKQVSNRKVLRAAREHIQPVSITFAIPDHPWRDEETDAKVRVAMTVGQSGDLLGRLQTVVAEKSVRYEIAEIELKERVGRINSDLTIGPDVSAAAPLKANRKLAYMGVIPVGEGFRVTPADMDRFSAEERARVFPYLNGENLTDNVGVERIIDVSLLTETELRDRFPNIYQHLLIHVRPARAAAERKNHRIKWWVFGEARVGMRKALAALPRFIGTVETAKFRLFHFIGSQVLPDQKIRVIASDDALILGILSSQPGLVWSSAAQSTLEDRPVYVNETCFDPFPFPADVPQALTDKIRAEAEALDALRKKVLAEHDNLTLTGLYNVLEALRQGRALTDKERAIHDRGLVTLIKQHHDTIDALVAQAYGWLADHEAGTLTDAVILERLVALNKERAAEEAKGIVRWLRPDFQAPGAAKAPVLADLDLGEMPAAPTASMLPWPKTLPEQVSAVAAVLASASTPMTPRDVAAAFKGKRAASVEPVLGALAAIGRARKLANGRYAA
ncbi:MAG: class I SAM-dependent DNA methyltransferase [Alphaproteobacteria bacterium]|nr:MAG: class I SAM-dependent DNA methyltransferase [Alphaproteobacteria bacterium]